MNNVLIIGGGEIGQAIRILLNDTPTEIFDIDDEKNEVTNIEESITRASVIFVCIPSKGLSDLDILDLLSQNVPLIFLTKGVDVKNNQYLYEVYKEKNVYFLYGPMIAEDIFNNHPTQAMLAGKEKNEDLEKMLQSDNFSVSYSPDIVGVYLSGILKNIYTLFLSGIQSLNMGTNIQGVAMTKILEEGQKIIADMGGNPKTFLSFAGVGDLVATSQSPHSTHAHIGELLAKQTKYNDETEAIRSISVLTQNLKDEYPIISFITKSLKEDTNFTAQNIDIANIFNQ